jgi:hypothetical protein
MFVMEFCFGTLIFTSRNPGVPRNYSGNTAVENR